MARRRDGRAAPPVGDRAPLAAVGRPMASRAAGGRIGSVAVERGIIPRFAAGGGPAIVGGRRVVGMGWQPDVPDRRDRTLRHPKVEAVLKAKKSSLLGDATPAALLPKVDNRAFCPPVEDQGTLGSCTAQAVVGMMEYMMRRSGIAHVDGSRLFLYKVTRKLLGWTSDTGAYLRSALQAAAVFGVPPEKHWPYEIARYDEEPDAFLYSYAANYQALNYARLDGPGQAGGQTLALVKRVLAAGYVVVFGFPVYDSLNSERPDIPYPSEQDSLLGGHAVAAVGYDDKHQADGAAVPSLIIRNSWGRSWGEGGYGYLPYRYVEDELALDFWTVFKAEWIDPSRFQ